MIDNLPNGWEIKEYSNVFKDITSGKKKIPTNDYLEKGNIPVIDQGQKYISGYTMQKEAENCDEPIIIFGDHTRALKYIDFNYAIGADGVKVLKNIEPNSNSRFLYYSLKNSHIPNTGYNRHFKYVKRLEFLIPPLQQQEKIVKVLDLTSNLIEKQKELLKNYDLFLKSKFIQMFGEPISNPMGWEVVKLDSLGKWQSGGTPSRTKPDFFKGNIDWYSAGELNHLYTIGSIEKITEEAIQKSSAKIFKENTLLIGMYDTAAFKMSILKKSSASNQAIANLDNDLKITNVLWLYFVFLAYKELYLNSRAGVRQQNLSLSKIKNFETILPPIELQNKFASIVEKIETIKEKENQKLKQMNDLHNSMMNKAFKGEIK